MAKTKKNTFLLSKVYTWVLRILAAVVILFITGFGIFLIGTSDEGSLASQLGFSMLSSGIISGAFMVAQTAMSHADMVRSSRSQVRMELVSEDHFPGIDLNKAYLEGVYLPNKVFFGAKMCQANLRNSSLQFANLIWADLSDADLFGSNLSGANLRNAKVVSANLLGADLTDVNFKSAKLFNANMSRAILRRVNFTDADLSSVDFSNAIVEECIFDGATMPEGVDTQGWGTVQYTEETVWGTDDTPPENTKVELPDISSMNLLEYLDFRKTKEK